MAQQLFSLFACLFFRETAQQPSLCWLACIFESNDTTTFSLSDGLVFSRATTQQPFSSLVHFLSRAMKQQPSLCQHTCFFKRNAATFSLSMCLLFQEQQSSNLFFVGNFLRAMPQQPFHLLACLVFQEK